MCRGMRWRRWIARVAVIEATLRHTWSLHTEPRMQCGASARALGENGMHNDNFLYSLFLEAEWEI